MIHITTGTGRTWRHVKEDDTWTRTGPSGRVHQLSADQLLSHLLSPLAGDQPGLTVRVEPRRRLAKGKTTAREKRPRSVRPRAAAKQQGRS